MQTLFRCLFTSVMPPTMLAVSFSAAALIVDALRADIGNILATVPDLAKHANSIDCSSGLSVLSLLTGPGEACNR